jgi:ABC-2 type transport system ATP-binding protein
MTAPTISAVRPSPPGEDAAVRTSALRKVFGSLVAVEGLDLEIHRGEVFGLLGPNGSGKTTTIRMLCGLLEPTAGEATVVGVDVAKDPDWTLAKAISSLPVRAKIMGTITAKPNIARKLMKKKTICKPSKLGFAKM